MEKIKVLLVEDIDVERREYKEQLEEAGFEVRTAVDAESAFKVYPQFKPYVVLTDYKFDKPEHNGVSLIKTLVQNYPNDSFVKIYMTSFGEDFIKEKTTLSDHYLAKGSDMAIAVKIGIDQFEQKQAAILRGYENDELTYNVNFGSAQKRHINVSKLVFIESKNVGKRTTITRFYVAGELDNDYFKVVNPNDFIKEMEGKGYMNMVRVHNSFAVNRAFVDDFDIADNVIYYQIKDKDGRRAGVREIKRSDKFNENIENLKKYRACKE